MGARTPNSALLEQVRLRVLQRLREADEDPIRPSNEAEPIHILILDHVADELRA